MSLLKKIYPEQPLKELRWFDIGIVTLIMFGQFIVRSTQMYLASLSPSLSTAISETSTNTASEGAAYSSNFTLQIILQPWRLFICGYVILTLNNCQSV